MPKETVLDAKRDSFDNFHWNYAKRDSFFTKVTKSRYIKDKVDALSKEKAQLKE